MNLNFNAHVPKSLSSLDFHGDAGGDHCLPHLLQFCPQQPSAALLAGQRLPVVPGQDSKGQWARTVFSIWAELTEVLLRILRPGPLLSNSGRGVLGSVMDSNGQLPGKIQALTCNISESMLPLWLIPSYQDGLSCLTKL